MLLGLTSKSDFQDIKEIILTEKWVMIFTMDHSHASKTNNMAVFIVEIHKKEHKILLS